MPTERKPAFPYFAGIAVYLFCSKNKPSASVTAMDYISGDPEKTCQSSSV